MFLDPDHILIALGITLVIFGASCLIEWLDRR